MNTLTNAKSKINPRSILGGIPGMLDEAGFEMEISSISSVTQGVKGVFEDMLSLGQDIAGVKSEEPEYKPDSSKFPSKGSIEFYKAKAAEDQKDKKEADRRKTFFQTLKDEQLKAQTAKDRMWFEEEMNDITANLPTEEKNRLLHYQASYKDRSIYQRAALRKKLIEEGRKAEKKSKEPAIPSPAKQASALNTQFEGGAGAVGGGQANLKFGIG